MLRTLPMLVTCITMTPNLKTAGSASQQDAQPARKSIGSRIRSGSQSDQAWITGHDSPRSVLDLSGRAQDVNREFLDMGSQRALRATSDIALHPEWQLLVDERTEWWRFSFKSATGQRNAEFAIQRSHSPMGRERR
jgi:hypothetical protein